VIQTLERIYKPREGCVWSAKGEEKKRKTFVKADPAIFKATPLQNIHLSLKSTFKSWEPTKEFRGNFQEFHMLLGHSSSIYPQAQALHTTQNAIPLHAS